MNKFQNLRHDHPIFIYDSFSKSLTDNFLEIKYKFIQSEDIIFEPTASFEIKNLTGDEIQFLDIAIFNLGMIELISYYKACCSPKIIVKAGFLSPEQISFWKEIYFNGLGEFLYKNDIETSKTELFDIISDCKTKDLNSDYHLHDGCIIPVGGGKDSIVTLELLADLNAVPLILNPRKASIDSVHNSGYNGYFEIRRKIDPKLLQLNKEGFLNGHTPFSALLAFAAVIACLLSKRKNIILSNENSASEGNAFFSGIEINHQYSKSYSAEKALHDYISKFIHKDINYFSFLRPINELKIAQIFSKYNKHFSTFRSCNAGSKNDVWCLNCPKCLFTYTILSPFIPPDELINIFGSNMFDNKDLEKTFWELTGNKGIKPFECVGTIDEVNSALAKTIFFYGNKKLPYLLEIFSRENKDNLTRYLNDFDIILNEFSDYNLLNDNFKKILTDNL